MQAETNPAIYSAQARGSSGRLGKVRVEVAATIHAPPEHLVALYLDCANWQRLFPATIRSARLVRQDAETITVEVDHRFEGRVINVVRPRSSNEIELEEWKRKFTATFTNRFEPVAGGTRYSVFADIRLRMPYALLAPLLHGYVRRTVRRYVLEPMRAYAERTSPT